VSQQKGRIMADLRLSLTGEVDLATAPSLLAELQRAIERSVANVVVDCVDLTFIDSTGLYVLEEARRALATQGRALHVVNVARRPRRIFEVLGQTELLHDDVGWG
jgi:anti-anti-sigma factor